MRDAAALIRAVRAQRILNARISYRDEARGLTVTLEFPIRTINVEPTKRLFQVDAGPLALPDLETWDGAMVSRVFLAHAAFSDWDAHGVHPAAGGRAAGDPGLVVGSARAGPPRPA